MPTHLSKPSIVLRFDFQNLSSLAILATPLVVLLAIIKMSRNLSSTLIFINKMGVTISSNNNAGCLHLGIVSYMFSWRYGMLSNTPSAKSYSL